MEYYVVKYSGPFGFIKPWTAVRDSETFSQQFLTPSIVEGIEKKMFPELLRASGIKAIKGHRLNYQTVDMQQERTWAKGGFKATKEKGVWKTNLGILSRGVMLNPNLYLAFGNEDYATRAMEQTVCLCRNEDILFPETLDQLTLDKWNEINGFELLFTESDQGFKVGYNRFNMNAEMFGKLKIYGNPIREV